MGWLHWLPSADHQGKDHCMRNVSCEGGILESALNMVYMNGGVLSDPSFPIHAGNVILVSYKNTTDWIWWHPRDHGGVLSDPSFPMALLRSFLVRMKVKAPPALFSPAYKGFLAGLIFLSRARRPLLSRARRPCWAELEPHVHCVSSFSCFLLYITTGQMHDDCTGEECFTLYHLSRPSGKQEIR